MLMQLFKCFLLYNPKMFALLFVDNMDQICFFKKRKMEKEHVGFYVLCMIYLKKIFCFVKRTLSIFFTLVSSVLSTRYNCDLCIPWWGM